MDSRCPNTEHNIIPPNKKLTDGRLSTDARSATYSVLQGLPSGREQEPLLEVVRPGPLLENIRCSLSLSLFLSLRYEHLLSSRECSLPIKIRVKIITVELRMGCGSCASFAFVLVCCSLSAVRELKCPPHNFFPFDDDKQLRDAPQARSILWCNQHQQIFDPIGCPGAPERASYR